ncbi:ubiquitin carboxyl-terminal hydrolase 15-like [Mytilus edulis]|uniref:ubiquitin carboxyl-terminal hydrolase 15-like n=1 Tax=Mytilus edulis TaxID=6550 RepID=UPI0039EE0F5E
MASGGWDLESQKTEIRDLLNTPLVKGDKWYLLATSWFKQWKKYVGYESWNAFNVDEIEEHPGLIDNSPILEDDTGKLQERLVDELDYQLVPLDAWNKLVSCYGILNDQVIIIFSFNYS